LSPSAKRALALLGMTALMLDAVAVADELEPFTASYAWVWHGMTVAVSTLDLDHHEADWSYRSKSQPRGIGRMFSERPTQESVLTVAGSSVRPLTYKADDGTPSTKRDVDVRFDWAAGRVTGIYEDTKVDMPAQPGLQDDLSIQIALMVDLLSGTVPEKLLLLDKNRTREYQYSRDGEETLATPAGSIPTVIYQSQKAGSPRVTRFWCAPSQGYIPLRVQQTRKGDVEWTMQILSVRRR
jgi:hypothetical protein